MGKLITELFEASTTRNFLIVQKDENRKDDKTCYFEELLQQISNIRSSNRKSYQKVIDIYVSSADYNIDTKLTKKFFATLQNKIYFVVCGKATSEIITKKTNDVKPFMGFNVFKLGYIIESNTFVAKNYLNKNELMQLNLIVSLYIDFAELQAGLGRLMKMQDWIKNLMSFLLFSEFDKYRKERYKKFESYFDCEYQRLLDNKQLKNGNKK